MKNRTIQKTVTIENVIDIEDELNKICRKTRFSRKFNLPTGFDAPSKTFLISQIPLNACEKGLLTFLGIEKVTGKADYEYDNFCFFSRDNTYHANNAS